MANWIACAPSDVLISFWTANSGEYARLETVKWVLFYNFIKYNAGPRIIKQIENLDECSFLGAQKPSQKITYVYHFSTKIISVTFILSVLLSNVCDLGLNFPRFLESGQCFFPNSSW